MDFETLVASRRSIRGYKPDPVPQELMAEITASVMASIAALSGQEFRDESVPPPAVAAANQ